MGTVSNALGASRVEINYLPCSQKEHLIQADWWSCTARASSPVLVFGAYESRLPIFFPHVYLAMPREVTPPTVKWRDTRGLISFAQKDTFNGPAGAVAAPGYQILTSARGPNRKERSGRTTLVATLSGSLKQTLRVPAVVYRTFSTGCGGFAHAEGLAFKTGDDKSAEGVPDRSDLYVTGPASTPPAAGASPGPNGCAAAFADTVNDYTLHFPSGGTMLKAPHFDRLTASSWKNDLTSISLQDIKDTGFLFKSRGGGIVKALILDVTQGRVSGIFETADSRGVFPY